MDTGAGASSVTGSQITVRYWAAARAAAGVECDRIATSSTLTLAEILTRLRTLRPSRGLPELLPQCSVLVADRPVSSRPPEDVEVHPGQTVEILPPFAGG